MFEIIFPDDTKDIIDKIRDSIGREIEIFYVSGYITCSACNLDPVTNTSTDSFCPVCSGLYYIPIYTGYVVSAHVTWAGHDLLNWYHGGQVFEGECRVQIEYTDTVNNIVDNARLHGFVKVDNKIMEIRSKILRGVKRINRIILNLIEKEK